jgi:hypothetical protein
MGDVPEFSDSVKNSRTRPKKETRIYKEAFIPFTFGFFFRVLLLLHFGFLSGFEFHTGSPALSAG